MNIEIVGKNITINENVKRTVIDTLKKLEKFTKFIHEDTVARVEIRHYTENIYKVTVNISLTHNKHLHCEEKNYDLVSAIKSVIVPLEKQIDHLKSQYRSNQNVSVNEIFKKEETETDYLENEDN